MKLIIGSHFENSLLGLYVANIGSHLPTSRDHLSVPFSRVAQSVFFKMRGTDCLEVSVNDYKFSLFNVPEERRPHIPSSRSHEYHIFPRLRKCDVSALVLRLKGVGEYFIYTVYNTATANNADCSEERTNVPFSWCTQLAH